MSSPSTSTPLTASHALAHVPLLSSSVASSSPNLVRTWSYTSTPGFGRPMPNLTRANTLSPHTSSIMLRMPLCPPCPPLPLSLIAPTAVSRSSYTTSRLEFGILYHRHSDRTDSPLRFMYVWGFARSTGTPAILPTPTFARCLAASVHDMPSVRARMSSTSNPALCLVPSNLEPGLPRPTRSQRPGSATPAPADPWPRTLSIRRIGAVTTLRTTASKPMGAGTRAQLPRQHCLSSTTRQT